MSFSLLGVTFGVAFVDWLSVFNEWRPVEKITKPLVMIILFGWMCTYCGLHGPIVWFAVGIGFSMLGDIFLLPQVNRLSWGIFFFMLAHIAYITGFNLHSSLLFDLPVLLLVGLLVLYGSIFYGQLSRSLRTRRLGRLQTPLLIYSIVISLMLLSAMVSPLRTEWSLGPALLVSTGAVLFFISDCILAWNRFMKRLPYGRLLTRIPYHIGQVSLIVGAALNFKI